MIEAWVGLDCSFAKVTNDLSGRARSLGTVSSKRDQSKLSFKKGAQLIIDVRSKARGYRRVNSGESINRGIRWSRGNPVEVDLQNFQTEVLEKSKQWVLAEFYAEGAEPSTRCVCCWTGRGATLANYSGPELTCSEILRSSSNWALRLPTVKSSMRASLPGIGGPSNRGIRSRGT